MVIRRRRPDGGEDDIDLDEQLLNLLPEELRDSDDYYLEDEDEPPRGRGGMFAIIGGIAFGVLVAGIAAWYLLGGGSSDTAGTPADLPLVSADPTPYKARPEEPGGMQVENRDKLVYNRISEDEDQKTADATTEKLLPDPEQPMTPPVAVQPEPVPQPQAVSPVPVQPVPMEPVPSPAPVQSVQPVPVQPVPIQPVPVQPVPVQPVPTPPVQAAPVRPAPPPAVAAAPSQPRAPAAGQPQPLTAPTPAPARPTASAPAAAANQTASLPTIRPAAGGTGVVVQLAALRSAEAAEVAWKGLVTKHRDLLGSLTHDVQKADLKEKGLFFRLRAGPVSSAAEAKSLCDALKSRNQSCIIVR
ncbi:SPOR domain-containing protein [Rhodospirillum rubrum]|uniref:SPOR domain-containing protein n=1 Tax=Rhodospirillum rubrum (strain ATCC 11170 / ATH 1.1.1 / DSM 467 / LMG 4362 / NCIMB 8255 / S1) TaxID=269796 RepID=Q2RTG7_RHORT|nr:SPOR domain-containing protein [Rhodospirillum rubrum]ABC22578.1 conserved hypothetical protein [Rhodospirillum rubrum ATCC 11170]AEO48296.1 hypothetical protein F11_09150 [Rhodospirillum rubrum F11]MBK5954167.1 SPOR domain-containing protein [Rhodospirillum rubrum]HAQ00249.1 SPOR domain-containing protein [Rhodospirillum rubrum]HCF18393.1 SPOR domain-containing protein [Rhodospirillum rubrum]